MISLISSDDVKWIKDMQNAGFTSNALDEMKQEIKDQQQISNLKSNYEDLVRTFEPGINNTTVNGGSYRLNKSVPSWNDLIISQEKWKDLGVYSRLVSVGVYKIFNTKFTFMESYNDKMYTLEVNFNGVTSQLVKLTNCILPISNESWWLFVFYNVYANKFIIPLLQLDMSTLEVSITLKEVSLHRNETMDFLSTVHISDVDKYMKYVAAQYQLERVITDASNELVKTESFNDQNGLGLLMKLNAILPAIIIQKNYELTSINLTMKEMTHPVLMGTNQVSGNVFGVGLARQGLIRSLLKYTDITTVPDESTQIPFNTYAIGLGSAVVGMPFFGNGEEFENGIQYHTGNYGIVGDLEVIGNVGGTPVTLVGHLQRIVELDDATRTAMYTSYAITLSANGETISASYVPATTDIWNELCGLTYHDQVGDLSSGIHAYLLMTAAQADKYKSWIDLSYEVSMSWDILSQLPVSYRIWIEPRASNLISNLEGNLTLELNGTEHEFNFAVTDYSFDNSNKSMVASSKVMTTELCNDALIINLNDYEFGFNPVYLNEATPRAVTSPGTKFKIYPLKGTTPINKFADAAQSVKYEHYQLTHLVENTYNFTMNAEVGILPNPALNEYYTNIDVLGIYPPEYLKAGVDYTNLIGIPIYQPLTSIKNQILWQQNYLFGQTVQCDSYPKTPLAGQTSRLGYSSSEVENASDWLTNNTIIGEVVASCSNVVNVVEGKTYLNDTYQLGDVSQFESSPLVHDVYNYKRVGTNLSNLTIALTFLSEDHPTGTQVSDNIYQTTYILNRLLLTFKMLVQITDELINMSSMITHLATALDQINTYLVKLTDFVNEIAEMVTQMTEHKTSVLSVLEEVFTALGVVFDIVYPPIGVLFTVAAVAIGSYESFSEGNVTGGVLQAVTAALIAGVGLGHVFSKKGSLDEISENRFGDLETVNEAIPNEYVDNINANCGRVGTSNSYSGLEEDIYAPITGRQLAPGFEWLEGTSARDIRTGTITNNTRRYTSLDMEHPLDSSVECFQEILGVTVGESTDFEAEEGWYLSRILNGSVQELSDGIFSETWDHTSWGSSDYKSNFLNAVEDLKSRFLTLMDVATKNNSNNGLLTYSYLQDIATKFSTNNTSISYERHPLILCSNFKVFQDGSIVDSHRKKAMDYLPLIFYG